MAMDGMYDRLCRAWPASLNAYIAACCMSSAVTCDDLRTGVAKPSCWARSSMTDTQIRSVSSTWAETHAKREQKVSAQQQCEATLAQANRGDERCYRRTAAAAGIACCG